MVKNELSEEMKTVKERVHTLLNQYEASRNSDNFLIEKYYEVYEQKTVQLSAVKSPVSTIIRMRRDVQALNPELAPTDEKVYIKRQRRSKEFKLLFGKQSAKSKISLL